MLSATAWQGLESEASQSRQTAASIPKARRGHAKPKAASSSGGATVRAEVADDSSSSSSSSEAGSRRPSYAQGSGLDEEMLALQQLAALHPEARQGPPMRKARGGGPQLRSVENSPISPKRAKGGRRAVRSGSVDVLSTSSSGSGGRGSELVGLKTLSNNSDTKQLDSDQMDQDAIVQLLMGGVAAGGDGDSTTPSKDGSLRRGRSRDATSRRTSSPSPSRVRRSRTVSRSSSLYGQAMSSPAAAAVATMDLGPPVVAASPMGTKRKSSRRRKAAGTLAVRQKSGSGPSPTRPPDPGDRRLSLSKPPAPAAP